MDCKRLKLRVRDPDTSPWQRMRATAQNIDRIAGDPHRTYADLLHGVEEEGLALYTFGASAPLADTESSIRRAADAMHTDGYRVAVVDCGGVYCNLCDKCHRVRVLSTEPRIEGAVVANILFNGCPRHLGCGDIDDQVFGSS